MRTGLVSITFRSLSSVEILELCRRNQLEMIEWGGDVHVPHGDLATAASVGEMTRAQGMGVAAYGSYYRLGAKPGQELDFKLVLDTAVELGAPAVRVWPGTIGSEAADSSYRRAIAEEARRIADQAVNRNVVVCFESHANTLTDTAASAVSLLEEVDHPNVKTLWQPPHEKSLEDCLDHLRAALPWLQHVHVFHWYPERSNRRPLAEGAERWKAYLDVLKPTGVPLLLEFVKGDDVSQLDADAATLHELVRAA